jgi:demethylmenaquinone methyltransferase/2-methoxy-6-polyprenyl-1,4-benzoquinol methylase
MSEPSRADIWKMFDRISPTYDRVNRAMTLGMDQYWRRKLAHYLPEREGIRLLDCATGTADQILALMERSERISCAVGIDLAEEMLAVGKRKIAKTPYCSKVSLEVCSALELSYPDNSFDCTTISFGIRNVTDVGRCLGEIYRVLTSKGRTLILECSLPTNPFLRKIHAGYLRHFLPCIGAVISKHKEAYDYLNKTVESFPCGENFCSLLKEAGFKNVHAHPLTGGIVTLYRGDKT